MVVDRRSVRYNMYLCNAMKAFCLTSFHDKSSCSFEFPLVLNRLAGYKRWIDLKFARLAIALMRDDVTISLVT